MSTASEVGSVKHDVFKYRAVNDRTLSILRNGAVYFSSAVELNDPFEARFANRDLSLQKQQFEDECRTKGTDAARLAIAMDGHFQRKHLAGKVNKRIFCFSEIVDSTLMWSHYADSHRGTCIVFEAEEVGGYWWMSFATTSFGFADQACVRIATDGQVKVLSRSLPPSAESAYLPVHRVLYSDQVPRVVTYDPLPQGTGATFDFVKHVAWSYERERRIVVHESFLAENPVHLSSDAIVGVVFGLKASKLDAQRVQGAISDRAGVCSIVYSHMIERPDGFGLDRVPITELDALIHSR